MSETLVGKTGTTTVNLLATAMDAITPAKKEVEQVEVLTPKQQRRADRKAVRLRKKG